MRSRDCHTYMERKSFLSSSSLSLDVVSSFSNNCFIALKSHFHTQQFCLLLLTFYSLLEGTMGPAAAWENPQETWLPKSQIPGCGKFSRRWSLERLTKYRIAIPNPIPKHRLTSHLSGSALQGAVVHGESLFHCCVIIYSSPCAQASGQCRVTLSAFPTALSMR